MASAHRTAAALVLLVALMAPAARAADTAGAKAVVQDLCDGLLGSMKKGAQAGFAAHRDFLAPIVSRDLDLPFMTRLVVGPPWRSLKADDGRKLVAAFSAYSIATYAAQFQGFSGERFVVDPAPVSAPRGGCIVHTHLLTGGQSVELDYLMRDEPGGWKIIDIYLNGTISEMAARRSEYSATLQAGGAPALVSLLQKKTADLAK